MIFADRLATKSRRIREEREASKESKPFAKRVGKVTNMLAVKYRTASEVEQNDYNFALGLITQATVLYNSGATSEAERMLAVARKLAK